MNILSKIVVLNAILITCIATASPENALKEVAAELDELRSKSRNIIPLAKDSSLSPHQQNGLASLEKAKTNYIQKEYSAVIRSLNFYLNNSQDPDEKDYLISQYLLGSSYQELNRVRKAMRAYNRYISSYITAKDKSSPYLIRAIQNILLLSSQLTKSEIQKTRELISALSSLDLPRKEMSRVLFYLALTSKDQKDDYFADRLFLESKEISDDQKLKAENIYFSALIPLNNKKLDKSKERFKKILDIKGTSAKEYRNFSALNIGRIEAYQEKYNTALQYYNKVEQSSQAYENALYEKVFVNFDLEDYNEAYRVANQYLEKFKIPIKLETLNHITPYLKLKAENIPETDSSINHRITRIKNFKTWLTNIVNKEGKITDSDVKTISDKGTLVGIPPKTFQIASRHFDRISILLKRLDDIRSETRSTVYSIGNVSPDSFTPEWTNRSENIGALAKEAFDLSDKILLIEQEAFSKYITPSAKIELKRSAERRANLKRKFGNLQYHRGRWQSRVTLIQLTQKLENIQSKLNETTSELRGMQYTFKDNRNLDQINHMVDRGTKLQRSVSRALEIIRSRSNRDIGNQSHNNGIHKYILDYTQVTHEESTILKAIRNQYSTPSEQHLSKDLLTVWNKWEFVVKQIYGLNQNLANEIKGNLKSGLNNLDQYIKSYEINRSKLLKIKNDLETILTKDIGTVASHYQTAMNKEMADLMKWKADNQWVSYLKTSRKRKEAEDNQNLKETKMKEDLRDLEYGAN